MNVAQLKGTDTDQFGLELARGRSFPEEFALEREVRLRRTDAGIFVDVDSAVWPYGLTMPPVDWSDDRRRDVGPLRVRVDEDQARRLRVLLDLGLPMLAWIVSRVADRLVVRARQFSGRCASGEPLVIAVAREVQRDANWLARNFIIAHPGKPEFGRIRVARLADDLGVPGLQLRVYGEHRNADAHIDEHGCFVLRNLAPPGPGLDARVNLVEAPIEFRPLALDVPPMPVALRAALQSIVEHERGFIDLWQDYQKREIDLLHDEIRAIGVLRYETFATVKKSVASDTREFTFSVTGGPELAEQLAALNRVEERTELEAAQEPPPEVAAIIAEVADGAVIPRSPGGGRRKKGEAQTGRFSGPVRDVQIAARTVTLGFGREQGWPPQNGCLYLSTKGTQASQDRRDAARKKLTSPLAPMPQLVLFIEERPYRVSQAERLPFMTERVLGTFQSRPTEKQQLALDVALNTPDIAIIQGPPGTGKTQVIRAFVERLAELADAGEPLGGLVLISSFQHAAVENAAAKVEIHGIPADKSPRRDQTGPDNFEKWRTRKLEALKERARDDAQLDEVRRVRRIQSLVHAYVLGQFGARRGADILSEVERLCENWVEPQLFAELQGALRRLRARSTIANGQSGDMDQLWRSVHAIRETPTGFADDGAARAGEALARLKMEPGLLSADETAFLRRIAYRKGEADLALLPALGALRHRLLVGLTERRNGTAFIERADPEICALLTRVLQSLTTGVHQAGLGTALVLANYIDRFEREPDTVRNAVARYATAVADTCQRSMTGRFDPALGRPVTRTFETVIVDEAARANPLDLFIPMSLARRRVVLVGDHRQLPHLLDRSIEAGLEQDLRKLLSLSLFEKLFSHAKRLEEQGGPKRTVTLDKQFRMPPALGDFVSKTFYEVDGERLESDAADHPRFDHGLEPYLDKAGRSRTAAWIDVPPRDQRPDTWEEKRGTSRIRPHESKRVAAELARLIRLAAESPNPRGKKLTFGVIAFYRSQADSIKRDLAPHKITKFEGGKCVLLPEYAENDRVAVGTVDEFQGKEFDVVFLSVTRSNREARPGAKTQQPAGHEPLDGELKTARARYGHLMTANRMCVAMSRQKRLLIVVGDASMLRNEDALWAIGPLVTFKRELCDALV